MLEALPWFEMRAEPPQDPAALLTAALSGDVRPSSTPGQPQPFGWNDATFAERTTPGGDARVWSVHLTGVAGRVVSGDGRGGAPVAFLKRHRSARKYRQEVAALQAWAPALAPHAPQLLARDDAGLVLLTTVVDGTPLDELDALDQLGARDHERRHAVTAYRALGAFTTRLHTLPVAEDDPVPPAEAYRLRVRAWCDGAEGHVDPATIDHVRAYASEAEAALVGARRVPCHRDLAPRNVLVTGADRVDPALVDAALANGVPPASTTLRVGVIDFEHARADLPWVDLVRLQAEVWLDRPELKEAFLQGFGETPDIGAGQAAHHTAVDPAPERTAWTDTDEALLARCVALHALATTAWAVRHGDARLATFGRRLLDRVIADR